MIRTVCWIFVVLLLGALAFNALTSCSSPTYPQANAEQKKMLDKMYGGDVDPWTMGDNLSASLCRMGVCGVDVQFASPGEAIPTRAVEVPLAAEEEGAGGNYVCDKRILRCWSYYDYSGLIHIKCDFTDCRPVTVAP